MVCTKETIEKNGINVWVDKAQDGSEPSVDIILVQGLGSHPYYTWTGRPELATRQTFEVPKRDALKVWLKRERSRTPTRDDSERSDSDFFWPRDLLPNHLPSAAIATYSYESGWRSKSARTELRKCGEQFLNLLYQYRQQNKKRRPIVFVGHSLGGLVIQQALVLANHGDEFIDIRQSTAGAIFLGVPMQGSDAAGYANWAINAAGRSSRAILETLQSGSDELFSLSDDFWRSYGKLPITMFYEDMETDYGPLRVRTVDFHSATMAGRRRIYLSTDHSGLNKFHGDNDENFKPFIQELKQITESIRESQTEKLPSIESVAKSIDIPRHSEVSTGFMSLPFTRDRSFIERSNVIEQLRKLLEESQDGPRAAIIGLGGVGKSQIAIEYAYRLRETNPGISIFWLHASNPARFRSSYEMIATQAQLQGLADPKSDKMDLVLRWLMSESSKKWLLIVDNADDIDFIHPQLAGSQTNSYDMNVASYIPQKKGGTVLVTSRYRDAAFALVGNMDRILTINPMSQEESQLLIDRYIPTHLGTTQERQDLISRMENLPLALSQAAAYISKAQRMSIGKYLRMFEKGASAQQALLMKDHGDLRRDSELTNSVIRTWQVSFDQILSHSNCAVELMSLMAMFDRSDIPVYLLSEDETDIETEDAIEVLLGYSFISEGVDSNSLSMHRLVQLATKQWLQSRGKLDEQYEIALTALINSYPDVEQETWEKCRSLEPHAQALLREGELPRSVQILQAKLNSYRSAYMINLGEYDIAHSLAEKTYDAQVKLLGFDHLDTLETATVLLDSYTDLADFREVEKLATRTLASARKTLGKDHEITFQSTFGLAYAYMYNKRMNEAKDLCNELAVAVKELPTSDALVSDFKALRLAMAIENGEYKEAEVLAKDLIEDLTSSCGAEHVNTLHNMNILSEALYKQERWADAEEPLSQALEVMERTIGRESALTQYTMSELAYVLERLQRYEEAERLLVPVIEIRKRLLGAQHQWTLDNLCQLGIIYYRQNRLREAEAILSESIDGRAESLGLEHWRALKSIEFMALVLRKLGRVEESLKFLAQSVELAKTHHGLESKNTLFRINRLNTWTLEHAATIESSKTASTSEGTESTSGVDQGSKHEEASQHITDRLALAKIDQETKQDTVSEEDIVHEDGWVDLRVDTSKDGGVG